MIEFSEVHDVKGETFREAMGIYLDAIPAAERQKVSVIEERVATGKEHLLIGLKSGEVACMALVYPLQDADFVLIDYLAVKKAYRQHRVGSSLIRHIQNAYSTKGKRLIGEVEDPKQGDDIQIRACRVAFYHNNGARELKNVLYLMPPMQGTHPTPMVLMMLTHGNESWMEGSAIKKLITQIYAQLYGRNINDTLLNTFIHQVPSTVKLE